MDKVLGVIRLDQEMIKHFLKEKGKLLKENDFLEFIELLVKYTKLNSIEEIRNFEAEYFRLKYFLIAINRIFTGAKPGSILITVNLLEKFFEKEAGSVDATKFFEETYEKYSSLIQKIKPRNRRIEVENTFLASDQISGNLHNYPLSKKNEFLGTTEKNEIELKEGEQNIFLSLLQTYEGEAEYSKPITQEEKVILNGIYSLYFGDMQKAEKEGRKVGMTLFQLYSQVFGSAPKSEESYTELAKIFNKLKTVDVVLTYNAKGESFRRETRLLPVERLTKISTGAELILFQDEPPIMEYARNKGQFRLYPTKPFQKTLKGGRLAAKHLQEYLIKIITAEGKPLGRGKGGFQSLSYETLKDNFPAKDTNVTKTRDRISKYTKATMTTAIEQGMIKEFKIEPNEKDFETLKWKK